MKQISFLIFSFAFIFNLQFASAQNLLPTPTNIQKTYQNGTRSTTGAPGKNYWQNAADYDIQISVDPDSRLIKGKANISYFNNSPNDLKELVFKLYPNMYQKGVMKDYNLSPEDLHDGVKISSVKINDSTINFNPKIVGTNWVLPRQKIVSKSKTKIEIEYEYILNKGSHYRMGQVDEGSMFIAYFFPRVAVYDDIDGWNVHPYTGSREFYNDFCNFKLDVALPKNYIMWSTGDLMNCNEVLQTKYCSRLAKAEREDDLIYIIDSTDLKNGNITLDKPILHWKFEAKNVTDVAFGISNHYLWQSSSVVVDPITKRRTRTEAAFNPKHKDYYLVASDARKTVEAMSYKFPKWPYPYNHITVFDGLDQMEYPMMANDNPVEDRAESIELTVHEIFHTMFPFYMGTNETKYAFMDEGWATIGEWLITPMIDSSIVDDYGIAPTNINAGNENDLPIITLTTQTSGVTAFLNNYPKPGFGYLYAKDILGDELFFKGLHHYIRNWNGKHPMPNDFFYSMNAGSGVNLNWFWKKWFFENGIADLALGKISGKGKNASINIISKGTKPVPIDLTVHYKNGTVKKIHKSPMVWSKGKSSTNVAIDASMPISKIELGSTYVLDANPKDNVINY